MFDYIRDPAEITRRSFEIIAAEADLGALPAAMRPVAARLVHASRHDRHRLRPRLLGGRGGDRRDRAPRRRGDRHRRRAWSRRECCTAPAGGERHPGRRRGPRRRGTCSAAPDRPARRPAWSAGGKARRRGGRIGNAPTALFRLLELCEANAGAAVAGAGLPGRLRRRGGIEGGADRRTALGVSFITLHGRRGGSAMAAAAVNALFLGEAPRERAMALDRRHRRGRARRVCRPPHGRSSTIAEVLVGAERHFARMPAAPFGAASASSGPRRCWRRPNASLPCAAGASRVLATGDPMHYGIGATIARRLAPDEVTVVPHVSSFALAAARLVWPLDRVTLLSVHGRPAERVLPHLAPGARLLLLAHDGHTPRTIAAMLCARGFGESRMTALAHMGGDQESRMDALAQTGRRRCRTCMCSRSNASPAPDAIWHPRVAGLPDDAFEHDGKLTKREVRALAHREAACRIAARCSGTSAPAAVRSPSNGCARPTTREAIALEPRADRRAMAARERRGARRAASRDSRRPSTRRVLPGCPTPDAVFIGGGRVRARRSARRATALQPGGRLVAHAVTLESEAVLLAAYARHGGELVRIAITRADPIGDFTGWRPAMPVTQWSLRETSAIHPGAPA